MAALVLSACSGKAIEEGTCTDDDDANFALCIEAGCSAYKSNEASGYSSCEGSLDTLSQTGSGACSFSGSGECEVVCSCSGGGSDSSDDAGSDGGSSGGDASSGSSSGGASSGGSSSGGSSSGDAGSDGSGSTGGDGAGTGSSSDGSGSDGDDAGSGGSGSTGGDSSGAPSADEMCDAVCADLWPCIWGELYDSVDCSTCDTWSESLVECLYDCEDSCSCAEADCGMTVLGG